MPNRLVQELLGQSLSAGLSAELAFAEALAALRADDLRIVMLSGDNRVTAEAVTRRLGIDEAEVLPEQKSAAVERLKAEGRAVAMSLSSVSVIANALRLRAMRL